MADTPETIEEAIDEVALGPKSASVDGQSFTQHSIAELIAADKYRKQAAANKAFGLKLLPIRLPGASS